MGSVAPSRCSTGFSSTARGWSEGIQNSACLSGSFSGSQGKSQPPTLGKFVQALRRKVFDVGDVLESAMIVVVASEIFPGEAGGGNVFRILIRRRRTPIDASKHGVTPLFRAMQHPERELGGYGILRVAGRFRYLERFDRSFLVTSFLTLLLCFREPGAARRAAAVPIWIHGSAAMSISGFRCALWSEWSPRPGRSYAAICQAPAAGVRVPDE